MNSPEYWATGATLSRAITTAIQVMVENRVKGEQWRGLEIMEHLFHCSDHIETYARRGEELGEEDHLAHAACRALMALQLREEAADARLKQAYETAEGRPRGSDE